MSRNNFKKLQIRLFKLQISPMVEVGRLVGVIMRLRNLIPEKVKLQLFRTAILPHLTYWFVVWHFLKASNPLDLERIQDKALRAIYCGKVSSYEKLLSAAGLPILSLSKRDFETRTATGREYFASLDRNCLPYFYTAQL